MPKYYWHVCHHCNGACCEVCEEAGGWWESAEEARTRLENETPPQSGAAMATQHSKAADRSEA